MTDAALFRAPDLAIVEDEDRVTVLDLGHLSATSSPVALTGGGVEIWSLIDGRRDEHEIVAELRRRHPDDDLEAVTRAFLADLVASGLITGGREASG